ncbi:MAG: hypothetical protein ACM3JI_01285 [Anaerolineae bacterium]
MNRAKKAMPTKLRKSLTKELREIPIESLVPDRRKIQGKLLPIEEELKKYPKRIAKKGKTAIASLKKGLKTKKTKKGMHQSKRTTPGLALSDYSIPEHVLKEGGRWIKTLSTQNIMQGRLLTKKLSKKRSGSQKRFPR